MFNKLKTSYLLIAFVVLAVIVSISLLSDKKSHSSSYKSDMQFRYCKSHNAESLPKSRRRGDDFRT